jgi:hypothetical protein
MGGSQFQASLRKKILQDPISTEKNLGTVVHTCHPSQNGKFKNGGVWSRLA